MCERERERERERKERERVSELVREERGREGGRERELYLLFGQWPIIYVCTTLEYQQSNNFSIYTHKNKSKPFTVC